MTLATTSSSPGKTAVVAFFPLAKLAAKLLAARRITTGVGFWGSHPEIDAARRILRGAATRTLPTAVAGVGLALLLCQSSQGTRIVLPDGRILDGKTVEWHSVSNKP